MLPSFALWVPLTLFGCAVGFGFMLGRIWR